LFIEKVYFKKYLYTTANIVFAGVNAIASMLILKIFGVGIYGLFTYYSNIDNLTDYIGSHLRSTFESAIPGSKNETQVIESFAILQLIFGLVSVFIFFVLSFLHNNNSDGVKICQIFMLLSPGKSYVAFFRSLSKVTGALLHYSLAILFVTLINIVVLILAYLGLSFFDYLLIRSFSLLFIALGLIYYSGFIKNLWVGSFNFGFSQLYKRSRSLILYSLSSLIYLVWDKLIIAFYFGVTDLGFYALAFILYSFVQILSTSLLSTDFKILIRDNAEAYRIILSDSVLIVIKFLIFSEIAMTILLKVSFFTVYLNTLKYLFWIIPSSLALVFIEAAYLHIISKGLLKLINVKFIIVSLIYLIGALSISIIFKDIVWFSIFFFFHQLLLIYIIVKNFDFLGNVFKSVLYKTKAPLLFFIIVHLIFIYLNYN
jgi:hypothetical protein